MKMFINHQPNMFDTSKVPVRKIYIGSEIVSENDLFLGIYTKKVPKKCRISYQSHICRTILNLNLFNIFESCFRK